MRAVMALAARRHHLSPRQLSFTFVLNVVNASWHKLQTAPDAKTYQREVIRLLDAAAQGTHPKRRKRRSFPVPHGIAAIRFPPARRIPMQLFKWHWAKPPAPLLDLTGGAGASACAWSFYIFQAAAAATSPRSEGWRA